MKSRKPLKITIRTSSVTNAFVQAIIPWREPLPSETKEALAVLGMTPDSIRCSYCGAKATDWDHLRPLVKGKRPTGYISDYRNLVPSCAPCNQSKSGRYWLEWIHGNAIGSPKARGVSDIEDRIERLQNFEAWGRVEPLDLAASVGQDLWERYWAELVAIEALMHEAQKTAIQISSLLHQKTEMNTSR